MQFLILRDPSGLAQVTFEKGRDPHLAGQISALAAESAVTVTGQVVENPVVKLGGLEVLLDSLSVENPAAAPLPFDPFAATLPEVDYRMDWRSIDLRRPENRLIFQVQTTIEMAMRAYWLREGFIEIHSPKLMGSPSESGAELFELPYFERKAYLAQSPQFYKQMAMAAGFERVFEIGPVFRADPSFTSRHMTEFTSVDMEMSWIDSHEEVMAFEERWLQAVYQQVREQHGEEIRARFGVDIQPPPIPFPRVTMAEAQAILKAAQYIVPPEKKGDIDPGGERVLGQYVKEKWGHDYVFLTDWPASARPFYHMRHPENDDLTRSFDLIACGLEITTGAQREHRAEVLARQAQEKGLGLEPIRFYLDFFRYGCPPHGGYALGLSRFLMILLGLNNVRDAVFLFRGPNRLSP
jgi:aspartyl-tRNA synthetase